MGLIPKLLSVVLLVGCLVAAGAMAGEPPYECPYNGRVPTPEEFATVLRNHQAWLESDRKPDDRRRANLCSANLQEAILNGVNLQQAQLSWANFQQAWLIAANLQEALLVGANLRGRPCRGQPPGGDPARGQPPGGPPGRG